MYCVCVCGSTAVVSGRGCSRIAVAPCWRLRLCIYKFGATGMQQQEPTGLEGASPSIVAAAYDGKTRAEGAVSYGFPLNASMQGDGLRAGLIGRG